jgi:hypothetical protein
MRMQRASNSRISLFKSCRRAYFLRYIEGLEPMKTASNLQIGRLVHEGIAGIYRYSFMGEPPQIEPILTEAVGPEMFAKMGPEELDDFWLAVSIVKHWHQGADPSLVNAVIFEGDRLAIEWSFEVPCGHARRFIGIWDGIVRYDGEWWVLEHKTTAGMDSKYLDKLLRDEQATGYVYAAAKLLDIPIAGILYNIIEKPRLRIKAKETHEEFRTRRDEWYEEGYHSDDTPRFHIQRVYRTQDQLDEYEAQLADVMADMRRTERDGAFYPSPASCAGSFYSCQFASLCPLDTPEAREGLYTRRER